MSEPGAKRGGAGALVVFFLIACIPPWIGWSLISFGVVSPHAPYATLLYITGWGVSLGGLVATGMKEGFGGVGRLLGDAVRVVAPLQWWLYVLLVPLALQTVAALLAFAAAGKPVAIDPAGLLTLATPGVLLPFLFGPFGEEFGWRGFLLPELARRVSAPLACLMVGVIWAVWHWPLEYQQILQAPGLVWFATCMSFLIGAVYLRTRSLLLAMIMHWNWNSMAQVSPHLFPGAPIASSAPLVAWGSAAAYALAALLTVPVLLGVQRKQGLHSGAG